MGIRQAPGAVLDQYPWAASWATFLQAVNNPDDNSARQVIRNAMSERAPDMGGFLVPWSLHKQVLAYMTSAIVRPRATVVEMDASRVGIPLLDNPDQSSGKQSLGGLTFSLVEVGDTIPATNPKVARMMLDARKIAAYLQGVPNELTADAAGAMGDLLARVIAMGLAWYEDDLFIANGTGTHGPQSLVNSAAAKTVARAGSNAVVLADIVGMAQVLHPAALQAGLTPGLTSVRWLLSSEVFSQILELYLNTGGATPGTNVTPVALSDWFSLGNGHDVGPSLLGLPASVTDHQPALGSTGDVILADLERYVVGDWLTMTVEQAAGGAGFPSDASDFRVRSRLDGRYWVQSQTTTEAGQQVSPVVVLQ
jgi:HK97 family phage major capsid protein